MVYSSACYCSSEWIFSGRIYIYISSNCTRILGFFSTKYDIARNISTIYRIFKGNIAQYGPIIERIFLKKTITIQSIVINIKRVTKKSKLLKCSQFSNFYMNQNCYKIIESKLDAWPMQCEIFNNGCIFLSNIHNTCRNNNIIKYAWKFIVRR